MACAIRGCPNQEAEQIGDEILCWEHAQERKDAPLETASIAPPENAMRRRGRPRTTA